MTEGLPWWATLVLSWVPGIGVAVWQLITLLDGRKKRAEDHNEAAAARLEATAQREREMVQQGVAQMLTNLRTDLEAYRTRLNEVSSELNKAVTFGRRWEALCWVLLGHARQARQTAESVARRGTQDVPVWPGKLPDLPGFDEIGPNIGD